MITILLVDDDQPFRMVIGRALRNAGHAVDEASDGKHALGILKAEAPDLIITDIIMPNGDGMELITAVRRTNPGVRILVVSGRARSGRLDMLGMAELMGADATLAKPFSPEELLEAVSQLMD